MKKLVFGLVLVLGIAFAQYPEKPITYIIPFNPGGESDVTARLQQSMLEEELGVEVVVTNQAGGGGAVAWSDFQRNAEADGYSVMGINLPHIIAQPISRDNAGYVTDGWEPLYFFHFTPSALIVPGDSQFDSVEDLVAFATENPQVVTTGGSGTFSANHLELLLFEQETGANLTYIPFTGSSPTYPAILGGHISSLFSYSTGAVRLDGDVKVLAVATEERLEAFPDVPTFLELGYDMVGGGAYRGVAVPTGTPQDVKDTLIAAFDKVTEGIAAEQLELGYVPTYISGDDAVALVAQIAEDYAPLIEANLGN